MSSRWSSSPSQVGSPGTTSGEPWRGLDASVAAASPNGRFSVFPLRSVPESDVLRDRALFSAGIGYADPTHYGDGAKEFPLEQYQDPLAVAVANAHGGGSTEPRNQRRAQAESLFADQLSSSIVRAKVMACRRQAPHRLQRPVPVAVQTTPEMTFASSVFHCLMQHRTLLDVCADGCAKYTERDAPLCHLITGSAAYCCANPQLIERLVHAAMPAVMLSDLRGGRPASYESSLGRRAPSPSDFLRAVVWKVFCETAVDPSRVPVNFSSDVVQSESLEKDDKLAAAWFQQVREATGNHPLVVDSAVVLCTTTACCSCWHRTVRFCWRFDLPLGVPEDITHWSHHHGHASGTPPQNDLDALVQYTFREKRLTGSDRILCRRNCTGTAVATDHHRQLRVCRWPYNLAVVLERTPASHHRLGRMNLGGPEFPAHFASTCARAPSKLYGVVRRNIVDAQTVDVGVYPEPKPMPQEDFGNTGDSSPYGRAGLPPGAARWYRCGLDGVDEIPFSAVVHPSRHRAADVSQSPSRRSERAIETSSGESFTDVLLYTSLPDTRMQC